MLTEKEIYEASVLTGEPVGRRYKVRLIEGNRLGSTGYYPEEMLKRDGPRIFVKGTPMYLDHATPDEKKFRPHGRVADFAGELAEDAYYEGDGLYADVEVFEHQIPLIKSLKDKIGISIRALGECIDETINGQTVPVFQKLTKARSADFVVRAGAGGRIVSVLEQAQEDSESASEEQEGRDNMDELLKAFGEFKSDVITRLTAIEEAAKPVVEEKKPEVEIDDAKTLEVAEALASSSLSAEGRKRVLDLHRANKKPLAELIEAEEAYVKTAKTAAEVEGVEEGVEAEESAKDDVKINLPTAWAVKKDK